MNKEATEELLILPITYDVPYHWSTGHFLGRFYQELRDSATIYGDICPKCGYCLVPPRILCPRCRVRMGDWIKLGPKGTVLCYSVVEQSFWDPHEAKMRPVPYTHAYLQLDGPLGGAFSHILEEIDPEKLKIGMRVEAVFKPREQRIGHLTDILHFRTIDE